MNALAYLLLFLTLAPVTESQAARKKIESLAVTDFIDCHDGDTCRFYAKGQKIKIRFSGIDAPEKGQADWALARSHLSALFQQRLADTELLCEGKSYDRKVCTVFVAGKNINQELVRLGYAWDEPRYSKGKYRSDQDDAKNKKLGIWAGTPTAPWEYRKSKKRRFR